MTAMNPDVLPVKNAANSLRENSSMGEFEITEALYCPECNWYLNPEMARFARIWGGFTCGGCRVQVTITG